MKNRKPIEEMGFWKFIVAIEEYILVITSFVAACIVAIGVFTRYVLGIDFFGQEEIITLIAERIRSRFEWGLITDIGSPDYETRMAILRRKKDMDDFELDDEILDYIATNIKSNIRELEGALNKLLAYSNLEHKQITMEVAIEELQNIISPDKPKEITPQLIIDVVCEHFGITLDQIKSKSRSNDIAKPRQIAMYLSKNMTDASLDSIGSLLGGRDHSTIIHGINKITDEYESNENIHNSIDTIKKKINPN